MVTGVVNKAIPSFLVSNRILCQKALEVKSDLCREEIFFSVRSIFHSYYLRWWNLRNVDGFLSNVPANFDSFQKLRFIRVEVRSSNACTLLLFFRIEKSGYHIIWKNPDLILKLGSRLSFSLNFMQDLDQSQQNVPSGFEFNWFLSATLFFSYI